MENIINLKGMSMTSVRHHRFHSVTYLCIARLHHYLNMMYSEWSNVFISETLSLTGTDRLPSVNGKDQIDAQPTTFRGRRNPLY